MRVFYERQCPEEDGGTHTLEGVTLLLRADYEDDNKEDQNSVPAFDDQTMVMMMMTMAIMTKGWWGHQGVSPFYWEQLPNWISSDTLDWGGLVHIVDIVDIGDILGTVDIAYTVDIVDIVHVVDVLGTVDIAYTLNIVDIVVEMGVDIVVTQSSSQFFS